jgi:TRAP-type C4-dicarboxylate transport system permease small subunit
MHKIRSLGVSLALELLLITPAYAADGDVTKVQNFIQNIIQLLVTLAGLIAAGFFVVGGISYITSSGHPERLDRSKQTIMYSGLGLAIALGAFVLTGVISGIATKSFGG